MTIHTGWNVTTLANINFIYVGLQIEVKITNNLKLLVWIINLKEHWGFQLPAWTKTVWPKIIKDANYDYYHEATANNNLTKYAVGKLIIHEIKPKHAVLIIDFKAFCWKKFWMIQKIKLMI